MDDSPAITLGYQPPPGAYDAAGPVPSGYDVICEQCGYSLVGLAGSRCPECGAPFDPAALPFARVPWLHRRRLGKWRAYWQTVTWVLRDPHSFAAELCRPVRISADDARRFRKITTHLAAVSAALTVAVFPLLMRRQLFGTGMPVALPYLGTLLLTIGVWLCGLIFLRLATDMPLFIWKGLPNLPPSELAPLHHYAAAPLALAPLALPMVAIWPALAITMNAPEVLVLLAVLLALLSLGAWLMFLWRIPQVLMKSATRCGGGRVAMLALYLPAHWLMMAIVVALSAITAGFVLALAFDALLDALRI